MLYGLASPLIHFPCILFHCFLFFTVFLWLIFKVIPDFIYFVFWLRLCIVFACWWRRWVWKPYVIQIIDYRILSRLLSWTYITHTCFAKHVCLYKCRFTEIVFVVILVKFIGSVERILRPVIIRLLILVIFSLSIVGGFWVIKNSIETILLLWFSRSSSRSSRSASKWVRSWINNACCRLRWWEWHR